MSLDRLLTVSISTWKVSYLTAKRAAIVSALCCILIIGLNIDILFLYGYDESGLDQTNKTSTATFCFPSADPRASFMATWLVVSIEAVYSVFLKNIS